MKYEVSTPMFVLPFIQIEAENEEEAREKYMAEVTRVIKTAFNNVDVRELDDTDRTPETFKVEPIC